MVLDYKKIEHKAGLFILWAFASLILLITFYTTNKGLVMEDEAWYLYLLKDVPHGVASTQFYKLFSNIFHGNIFHIRLFGVFADVISYIVFSTGIYLFLKKRKLDFRISFSTIVLLCVIGFSMFSIKVCGTISYVTLNRIIALIATGLLLAGLSVAPLVAACCLIIAGFVSGLLFFIMITNIPLLACSLLLIYLLYEKRYQSMLFFLLGSLLSFIVYFTLVESPASFLNDEILAYIKISVSAGKGANHGLLPIMRWVLMTVKFLLFNIFVPFLAIKGYNSLMSDMSTIQKKLCTILCLILFAIFFYYEGIKGEHYFASLIPFLVLYVFVLFQYKELFKNDKALVYVMGYIFVLPIFLSLGTDVDFKTRATEYVGYCFPFLFVGLHIEKTKKLLFVFYFFLVLYMANYCTLPFRMNWGNFVYASQTEALPKLGIKQDLKVDTAIIKNLKDIRRYIHDGDTVIISNQRFWGYSYYLSLQPVSYTFRFSEQDVIKNLNSTYRYAQSIKMLSSVYAPFEPDFIAKIEQQTGFTCVEAKELSIFRMVTLKSKVK